MPFGSTSGQSLCNPRCDEFKCDLFPTVCFNLHLKRTEQRVGRLLRIIKNTLAKNYRCCNVLWLSRRVPSRYRYSTLRPLMEFRGKNR